MIKVAVEIKDTNPKFFRDLLLRARGIQDSYVSIGVHEEAGSYPDGVSVAEVALWNEYGTRFTPERSFIRSAVDENMEQIQKWREEMISRILFENFPVEKALESMGFRIQELIRNKIKSNVPPPNAESTRREKQKAGVGEGTLINSGLLLRSITYKVVMK